MVLPVSQQQQPTSEVSVTPHSFMQSQATNLMSPDNGNPSETTSGMFGSVTNPGILGSDLMTPNSIDPTNVTTSGNPDIIPKLQNVVSTVNLGCELDLKKIALRTRNAEYNPKRFAAVIMRIRSPRTTALIFSTGKMVCLGAKSEEESSLAARKYARIVQKLGFPAKFIDFKIQNIVGSFDVKFVVKIETLVSGMRHNQFCSYEPELFPGLIYRMVKPRVVLLIFISGKVVLLGAKKKQEIYEAIHNIYPVLKAYKK